MTPFAFGAYGMRFRTGHAGQAYSAYAGNAEEPCTDWYLLGKRLYSPALRHFLGADPLSPLGESGCNRYAYCNGDPINHVDPSGNMRRPIAVPHGATPLQGKSILPGRPLTPSIMAVATAAEKHAAVATANLPFDAPITRMPGNAVLGNAARPNSDSSSSHRAGPRVNILHEEDFPEHRWTVNAHGDPDLARNWIQRAHVSNEKSAILAADTRLFGPDIETLVATLQAQGASSVSIYSGAHGVSNGMNWGPDSFFRRELEQFEFLANDLERIKDDAEMFGMAVHVADVTNLNREAMQEMLAQDGIHIIGYCYGIADEEVMKAIGLQQATVYVRAMPPPRYTRPVA